MPMGDLQNELNEKQNRSVGRARAISRALGDAARRARFSSRSKEAFYGVRGARRRLRHKIIRLFLLILVVVLPNAASIAYYGFVASNQYEAMAKFTVSSGVVPKMDDLGSATGLPPIAIIQNTMIVVSYVESQALVAHLQDSIQLKKFYT